MSQSANLLALAYLFEKLASIAIHNSFMNVMAKSLKAYKDNVFEWAEKNSGILKDLLNNEFGLSDDNSIMEAYIDAIGIKVQMLLISQNRLDFENENFEYHNFKVLEESILQPLGKIPTLYMYRVTTNDTGPVLNKEVAQDDYLFKFLDISFPSLKENEVLEFINNNKAAIDKMRSLFHNQPKYLGSGASGTAFSIGPSLVLKLYTNPKVGDHIYEKTEDAVNRLHKQPELAATEAMIYDSGILGKFRNEIIYYYIIEKMKTIESFNKDVQDLLLLVQMQIIQQIRDSQKLSTLKAAFKYTNDRVALKNEIEDWAAQLGTEIISSKQKDKEGLTYANYVDYIEENIPELKSNWLFNFTVELIVKYLTGRLDLHMGNLGVTQYGQLRYFDPTHGRPLSETEDTAQQDS